MNLFIQEEVEYSGRTGSSEAQRNHENLRVVVKNVPFAIQAAALVFTGQLFGEELLWKT